MDDLIAILRQIILEPDEDLHRLVYADALDERGEPGDAEHATVIRSQCESKKIHTCECYPSLFVVPSCSCCEAVKPIYDETDVSLRFITDRFRPDVSFSWAVLEGDYFDEIDTPSSFLTRGFVHTVTCDAPTFLRHADALIWHPTQTAACPKCGGFGGDISGWTCRSCTGPLHRVPRPCPPTAQPVRRVVLTTVPLSSGRSDNVPLPVSWFQQKWPGVEFVLPLYTATMAVAAALHGMEVPVSATELYEATGLTPPTE